ncbi:outer membrane protein [Pseudazoarcus pumilus]|uniref:outer membrane protein n=1 Tax=Pseudazoarcus pumilus TaxID=2067960 RepID=UPI000F4E6F5E|nr:outer membrane beta-barrel protein [Pseudazoarcus pumilus]
MALAPIIGEAPHHGETDMIRIRACLLALAATFPLAGQALADGFYWGLEGAHERITFEPHYFTLEGPPDNSYTDRARGQAGSLVLGHRWQAADRLSIAVEGRAGASNTEFALSIPEEPARFRYDIPYAFAISVQPTLHVNDAFSLYVEGGWSYGRLRERKSSPSSSTYDEAGWRGGALLGLGVNLRLGEAWSARLGLREIRYGALRYTSRLADGSPVERVRDRPEVRSWHLGLMRRF